MTENAGTIVRNLHLKIGALISEYQVEVLTEVSGWSSISITFDNGTNNTLSLYSWGDCPNIKEYGWAFWNESQTIWLESGLNSDASSEEVLDFLEKAIVKAEALEASGDY